MKREKLEFKNCLELLLLEPRMVNRGPYHFYRIQGRWLQHPGAVIKPDGTDWDPPHQIDVKIT